MAEPEIQRQQVNSEQFLMVMYRYQMFYLESSLIVFFVVVSLLTGSVLSSLS